MQISKAPYQPLSETELKNIHQAAMKVLEQTGMADPPESIIETAMSAGCKISDKGRLCFPPALVEDMIAHFKRVDVLHGRDPQKSIEWKNGSVNYGMGGEAPSVIDFESGQYRDPLLVDYYDIIRLGDTLENVNFSTGVVTPTDVNTDELELNQLYVSLAASTKPFPTGFESPSLIKPSLEMIELVLGGEGKFRETPCCVAGSCPTVSPLRYKQSEMEILFEAARHGFPIIYIVAAMSGSTAPVTLAGTLVQTIAESLGVAMAIELVVPGVPLIHGMWPFVSDLRSGAFSGGGGEEALLSAAAAQILNWYGLTGSVSGGISDSKIIDAQAGYEKAISATLTSEARGVLIGEPLGLMASLMAFSYEAMVIDDEMLSNIRRITRGIEVSDDTLSTNVIDEISTDSGMYLMHPQTLSRMRTEYVYPKLADRSNLEDWQVRGEQDIRARARDEVRRILSNHYPSYIEPVVDKKIRDKFSIHLSLEAMQPNCGRW